MASSKLDRRSQNALDVSRQGALYFTVTFAVLAGLAEIAQLLSDPVPGWLGTSGDVLFVLVMGGGILMGVLFAVHLATSGR